MIVSVTTVRMPELADLRLERLVEPVEHEHVGDARVLPSHAEGARLVPERREHPVGRALQRVAADDSRDGDDGHAAAAGRLEPGFDAGNGQDRAEPRRTGSTGR